MTDRFRLKERGWILLLSELSGSFSVGNVLCWRLGEQGVQETPVRGIAMPNPPRWDEGQDILIDPLPEESIRTLVGSRVEFFRPSEP